MSEKLKIDEKSSHILLNSQGLWYAKWLVWSHGHSFWKICKTMHCRKRYLHFPIIFICFANRAQFSKLFSQNEHAIELVILHTISKLRLVNIVTGWSDFGSSNLLPHPISFPPANCFLPVQAPKRSRQGQAIYQPCSLFQTAYLLCQVGMHVGGWGKDEW